MITQSLDKKPAQYLKGVGPYIGKLLQKCGIESVQDVILHFPFRYQDRTKITPISHLRVDEWVGVEGEIVEVKHQRRFIAKIVEGSSVLNLLFFHSTQPQKAEFIAGRKIRCYGEVKYTSFGLTLIHPEYEFIDENHPKPIETTLTPIYPSTEGLSQKTWRKIVPQALQFLTEGSFPDYLNQGSLVEYIKQMHHPISLDMQKKAQEHLVFEELAAHHLSLKIRKQKIKKEDAPQFVVNEKLNHQWLSQLPFILTSAQKKVNQDVLTDLSQKHPMLRLVQGDVGSGKTVVAAFAALQALSNHYQVALMAPTEILSEQHYQQFKKWFNEFDVEVILLNSQLTQSQKKNVFEKMKSQEKLIAIGTHALFQEQVEFKKLGLVIIDEQHRFGVAQRLALKQKGLSPHQLIMTATPIPRTLAMTFYADLDVSIIDELPPGRTPIQTVVVNQNRRHEVIGNLRKAHHEKQQVYWVCTLVEESEMLQCQAAQTTAEQLKILLPEFKIGLVHGKLKSKEKESVMQGFKENKIDLLVATTVIEVGVDVPNASIMVIENAERLGLSQLHQLRGRVGRGSRQSYCILLYQPPLSFEAKERLRVMRETQDGFKIAEKDLALRGPGELLGTRQTGEFNFHIADLARDQHLFEKVQNVCDQLIQNSPKRVYLIIERWLGKTSQFQEV